MWSSNQLRLLFRYTKMIVLVFSVFSMAGCNDEDDNSYEDIIKENITINNTDTFLYDLGGFGDEESASIQKQAMHFELSALNRDSYTGNITFTYKPKIDFTGTDYLEILAARGSDGASANSRLTLVKLSFRVTDKNALFLSELGQPNN